MEEWKDIEGWEGKYQVSDIGRIRNIVTGHILKPKEKKAGYLFVGFSRNNKLKYYHIHRLVAQAYIPNPENLPQVNHKDENKKNNCVANLEWCTAQYNNQYGTKVARWKEKRKNYRVSNETKKKLMVPVIQMKDGVEIARFEGIVEASRITGISNISAACRRATFIDKQGLRHTHMTAGGFEWKYA